MPLNEGATNEIKLFAAEGTVEAGDLMSTADYQTNNGRLRGHQAGIADRGLMNRSMRQISKMAAGLAQYIANRHESGVLDDADLDALEAGLAAAILTQIQANVPTIDLSGLLVAAQNLGDVPDKDIARNHLDVYRKTETYTRAQVDTLLSKLNTTAHIQERLPDGVYPSGALAGGWKDRAVALTTVSDPANFVSVASNTFTVVAGEYEVTVRSPCFYTGGYRHRLFCTTTDTAVTESVSENGGSGNQQIYCGNVYVESRFRLTVPEGGATYKIQYIAQVSYPSYGLGSPDYVAVGDEIYATTTLTKVG